MMRAPGRPLGQAGVRRASFSLVEILAVLLIVGILGAASMMGVTAFLNAFVTGRANAELTQKAENALQRMVMELRFTQAGIGNGLPLLAVSVDRTSVTYTSKRDSLAHTIGLTGTELKLDGRTLTDRVSSFQVYYESTTGEVRLVLGMERIGSFEASVYP